MTDQLTLADQIPAWCDDPIGEAWWAFRQAHPRVESELVRLARQWKDRRPNQPCGAKALIERLRWEIEIDGLDGSPKLNNSHTSLWARWLMERYPDLDGLFVLRERRSDRLTPTQPATAAFDVNKGGILPSRWEVLGDEGRVRHLIRKEDTHKCGIEAEALCGVVGFIGHHHASLNEVSGTPHCGMCEFRWRGILDAGLTERGVTGS